MRNCRNISWGLGLIGLLASISFFVWNNREYVYKGSSYYPFPEAYNFQLTDQNGEQFELADNTDKVVLLFFGYTNCPDVCPTTLAVYGRISEKLGENANQVVFVFITEDPQRDTEDKLKEYLSAFDPEIIGLTGSLDELEPIWAAYHVVPHNELEAKNNNESETNGNYLVAHTSRVFVIDRTGRLRLTFPYGMGINDMLQDILHLIKENE